MKVKNKNGEEIEIEETEVITAVKEEYEKQLQEKQKELEKQKEENQKAIEGLRKEHALQLRAIISGRKDPNEIDEFEGKEVDEEEEIIKQAKEILKKL